jgi:hypothetical protein
MAAPANGNEKDPWTTYEAAINAKKDKDTLIDATLKYASEMIKQVVTDKTEQEKTITELTNAKDLYKLILDGMTPTPDIKKNELFKYGLDNYFTLHKEKPLEVLIAAAKFLNLSRNFTEESNELKKFKNISEAKEELAGVVAGLAFFKSNSSDSPDLQVKHAFNKVEDRKVMCVFANLTWRMFKIDQENLQGDFLIPLHEITNKDSYLMMKYFVQIVSFILFTHFYIKKKSLITITINRKGQGAKINNLISCDKENTSFKLLIDNLTELKTMMGAANGAITVVTPAAGGSKKQKCSYIPTDHKKVVTIKGIRRARKIWKKNGSEYVRVIDKKTNKCVFKKVA